MTSDDHQIARLRTFAVLLERGEEVEIEEYAWSGSERGKYKITISSDDVLFWSTFHEIHAHGEQD